MLGWTPATTFADGIARTIEFYRGHLERYLLDGPQPESRAGDVERHPGGRPRPPRRGLEPELSAAVDACVDSGRYLLGPETEAFEAEFAAFCGRRHAVAVASGTDALRLALVALGVGPRATR